MIPPPPKGAPAADQEFGLSIFEKFPPATARACPHEGAAAARAKPPGSVLSEVKQFIRMVPPPASKGFLPVDQELGLSIISKDLLPQ
jgi:hypothetical protein